MILFLSIHFYLQWFILFYFLSSKNADLLRNLTDSGGIEPIIVLFNQILFFIISNKNKQNLKSKKIKFSLSYSFFICPITFFAFYIRANSTFIDICNISLIWSIYRFIGVFLFLTIINVLLECFCIFYKKLFKIKKQIMSVYLSYIFFI